MRDWGRRIIIPGDHEPSDSATCPRKMTSHSGDPEFSERVMSLGPKR